MKAGFAFALCLSSLAFGAVSEPSAAVRFRFLNEALVQADQVTGKWDPAQRDCAGFVRYLYRRAVPADLPLWKGRDGQPALFLMADELLAYNFVPLDKVPKDDGIETGDLLAFHLPEKPPTEAFHLMVLLRPPGMATDRTLVVYHNGASGEDGKVRKVWLDDLRSGPPEWQPSARNPRFLGTFRWKGWADRFSKGR